MDWNIFWSAFGAIGTTLGSLITAGAVAVAVKQYKQPITKLIKVGFNSSIAMDINNRPVELYTLSVKNRGVRLVVINSVNLKGYKHNLFMNLMQSKLFDYKNFPSEVQPEECVDYYFEANKFRDELKKMVQDGYLKKSQNLIVFVQDSLGDEYYCDTKVKVRKFLE